MRTPLCGKLEPAQIDRRAYVDPVMTNCASADGVFVAGDRHC